MKTVVVLGIKNSGSGCIYDYLSSRNDFLSPFGSSEFHLCSDPMGIHNIYVNCYENFSFFNPSNSMSDFLEYVKKYQDHVVYPKLGQETRLFKTRFFDLSKEFIEKITKVIYYGNPEFSNFKISRIKDYYLRLKKKKKKFYPIRIPVDQKIFLKESQIFVKKIMQENLQEKIKNNQNVVLNQASNIFNPIKSSQYFENTKLIIVTRDPRDIFSSMKTRESKGAPSYDVNLFCDWFLNCFDNFTFKNRLKNNKIFNIKFENFVEDFEKQNTKLCKFLNIKKNYKVKKNYEFTFDLNKSKKNIYKSKTFLTKYEYNLIKKKLNKYLHW